MQNVLIIKLPRLHATIHNLYIQVCTGNTTCIQLQESKNISIKMLKDVGITVPKIRETSAVYKCKNISIKMLNDVGMTVPKSRETRAVYIQQYRG